MKYIFTLILFFISIIQLSAQEQNYVRDSLISPELMKSLQKLSKSADKKVVPKDSVITITGAISENDKIFFVDSNGEPSTQKGKYLYYFEGKQKNEQYVGVFQFFAPDAKDPKKMTLIKEVTYKNNKEDGPFQYFYPDGKVAQTGTYKNGMPDGKTFIFYPSGKVFSEFVYIAGQIDGKRTDFFPDGKTKRIFHVQNGSPIYMKTFYPNGNPEEEINYKGQEIHGIYRYYHDNGQLWVEREYCDGLLWNVRVNFDRNGKEVNKGTLKDGNGTVLYYDEKGKLYLTRTYQKGIQIK